MMNYAITLKKFVILAKILAVKFGCGFTASGILQVRSILIVHNDAIHFALFFSLGNLLLRSTMLKRGMVLEWLIRN